MPKSVPAIVARTSNADARQMSRHYLNRISSVKACRDCGRATVTPGGAVGVRLTQVEGVPRAGLAGLSTCGRIWLCAVCNSKVMARRALDLGLLLAWCEANKLRVLWGSLTFRHSRGDALAPALDLQRAAWRSMVSGRTWRDSAAKKGGVRVGYARAAEITDGANGWHPHFHPLIIADGTDVQCADLASRVLDDWISGVSRAGGVALDNSDGDGDNGAQQLKVLAPGEAGGFIADYITTTGFTKRELSAEKLAIETVWSQSKHGPKVNGSGRLAKTVAHWALLDGASVDTAGEIPDAAAARCLARWWELEDATNGHRMLSWSRDIRALAGLGVETSDEVEAARELGSIEDTVCFITAKGWTVVRDRPALRAAILHTLEQGGWGALRLLLDRERVEWSGIDERVLIEAPADELQLVGGALRSVQIDRYEPFAGHPVQLVQAIQPVDPETSGIPYIDPDLFSRFLKL